MNNKQIERQKFEKWWERKYHNGNPPRFGWDYWRDCEGYVSDGDTDTELQDLWEAWQAALISRQE